MKCEKCGALNLSLGTFFTPKGTEVEYLECPKCGNVWVVNQIDSREILVYEEEKL